MEELDGSDDVEQYLSVSQLTKYISRKFEYDPYLDRVYLKGEISNYNPRRKGHQYFNLKDEQSIISAVLFRGSARKVKFQPEDGMSVIVQGRVGVYARGGNYQIIIDSIEPDGLGALYLAYEQTKEKLSKEGLFATDLKQPISKYPKRIGVITSDSGAVIQDILTTVKRRFPIAEIVLFPTVVQGEKSADSIVKNIERAEAKEDIDTIIIGRGGGSFEDLFSFNEEQVVRAISNAKTPVISSVGHETDTTLTDLVADLRAPTPTAAAELAVPVLTDELLKLEEYSQRLTRSFQSKLQYLSGELSKISNSVIFRQPQRLYDGYLQNVDQLENKLLNEIERTLRNYKQAVEITSQRLKGYPITQYLKEQDVQVEHLTQKLEQELKDYLQKKQFRVRQSIQALEHLSPLKILARGYAVVENEEGVVRSVDEVSAGDSMQIRMNDGQLETVVEEIIKNKEQKDG